MAHLYRLGFTLVMCFWVALAHAAIPTVTQYRTSDWSDGVWSDSYSGACSLAVSWLQANSPGIPWSVRECTADGFVLGRSDSPSFSSSTYMLTRGGQCPANSTASGSSCICASGYSESGGACVPKASASSVCSSAMLDMATSGGAYQNASPLKDYAGSIADGATSCIVPYPTDRPEVGCSIAFEKQMEWTNDNGTKTSSGRYVFATASNSPIPCAPGVDGPAPTPNNPKADPSPTACEGYSGTYNGVATCVPNITKAGVDYVPQKTVEETQSQRVETSSSTSCSAGKCTTTTTTTTTDKATNTSTSSTSSKTVNEGQFCASDTQGWCKNGSPKYGGNGSDGDDDSDTDKSAFGGSCSAGFTCSGDAIQCSIAREQHKRNCEMHENTDSDEYRTYAAAKAVTGKVTDSLPGNRSIDIGAMLTGTTDRYLAGRGACPANRVIQGPNWSFEIPYSTICPYLEILGKILVIITSIAAIKSVVMRSKS